MTLMPIVERELRVRARRRAGHWARFGIALGAFLICLPQLLFSGPFGPATTFGKGSFDCMVAGAFLLSCGACFLSANAIATEHREGTLGLLFLTRVNALDVLLGKFGSAGLTSLCSLLAFVPIMLVPILAGGVTGSEALRTGLALLLTLSLALSLGLWTCAGTRHTGVLRNALGALLLTVLLPYLLWHFAPHGLRYFGVVSPLVAVVSAGDITYHSRPLWFWGSALGTLAVAALALLGATFALRRMAFQEAQAPSAFATAATNPARAATISRHPWRATADGCSPVCWLVQRQPGIRARLWTAALLMAAYHSAMYLLPHWLRAGGMRSVWALYWLPSLAVASVEGALIVWAVSQFFMESRQSAALEVLFTTPLVAKTIVADQWKALQRLVRGPVFVLLLPVLLQGLISFDGLPALARGTMPLEYRIQYAGSLVLSLFGVFLHVAALCWLGMWFGLKARSQTSAILRAVGLVVGAPYLLTMLFWVVISLFLSRLLSGFTGWSVMVSWLPQVLNLLVEIGLICWARNRLLSELAGAAPVQLSFRDSLTTAAQDTASAFRRARHWTPS